MGVTVKKSQYPLQQIIFDVLDKAVAVTQSTDVKVLAEEEAQKLRDKIKSNDYNFKTDPTSDYNKRKDREGSEGAGIPLMDTGDYVNSIEVQPTASGYSIGVRDEFHTKKRQSKSEPIHMRGLARVLEYGDFSRHIMPRPHWRPALANLRRRKAALTKELRNKVAKRADKALQDYLNQERNKEIRQYGDK